jgi:hypothetical protein
MHYISTAKLGWLMLFRETINIYNDNYAKHTNTFCGENAEL